MKFVSSCFPGCDARSQRKLMGSADCRLCALQSGSVSCPRQGHLLNQGASCQGGSLHGLSGGLSGHATNIACAFDSCQRFIARDLSSQHSRYCIVISRRMVFVAVLLCLTGAYELILKTSAFGLVTVYRYFVLRLGGGGMGGGGVGGGFSGR